MAGPGPIRENSVMENPEAWMQQALALAGRAVGVAEPNPRVGCVIVSADGARVLGQGHTQPVGQAHAEVMALRDAAARGQETPSPSPERRAGSATTAA